ncbi:MAG: hypothetical protein ACKO0Z_01785 [Betaproteobacteria bacterium]
MKHAMKISGKDVVLTPDQLDRIVRVLASAEVIEEFHVGEGKGTVGYKKAYLPDITSRSTHEWLQTTALDDDFVESSKLVVKMQREQNI